MVIMIFEYGFDVRCVFFVGFYVCNYGCMESKKSYLIWV